MRIHHHTNLIELSDRLAGDCELPNDQLHEIVGQLTEWAMAADCGDDGLRARGAGTLSQLAELAAAVRDGGDGAMFRDLISFVSGNLRLLDEPDNAQNSEAIDGFMLLASERWSEYLVCLESCGNPMGSSDHDWPAGMVDSGNESAGSSAEVWDEQHANDERFQIVDPGNQIGLLLSAIGKAALDHDHGIGELEQSAELGSRANGTEAQTSATPLFTDDAGALFDDHEMREAFLDDATRCLDMMEKSSLAVEQSPTDSASVRQFCRELHTLKGASGSVGLAELASYIHEVESSLEHLQGAATEKTVESMLAAVDRVRQVVARVRQAKSDSARTSAENGSDSTTPATSLSISSSSGSESLIRIRVSKLDRLMDMLAELVVLRNRRESHIAEFGMVNDELSRCSSRLSFCQDSHEFRTGPRFDSSIHAGAISGSNTLAEIAKDISVVSTSIRDLQKPVSKDNQAISRFIRDFRQELMQLRRVPIAGLFHRLQRAARDAARKEGKKIQLVCVGQETGLEQELQEKLHEPLLHIIRNAVSHGIEAAEIRQQGGKNESGSITLEAQSNSQLLAIEIRDDGGGLDYDAIRRRAIDKGLIAANHTHSHEELGRLIFHPGFSTCNQATQVSGRGVGMDIVANVLEQMRGRIEIDSVRGRGTTMRLVVPLRSAIEHVMVFRASGQLFALPMQSVAGANPAGKAAETLAKLSLSSMLSLPESHPSAVHSVLVLTGNRRIDSAGSDSGSPCAAERIGLVVDDIVGPEEVVVRHIPAPLNRHPLFCGLTLSGAGETVLVLDGRKLVDFFHQFTGLNQCPREPDAKPTAAKKKRVLVVDDSLSARKFLVKKLHRLGCTTIEAGDGIEGLEFLRQETFDLVITDLDMPRLGGLEMLFDIQQRQKGDSRGVPVLVVSGRNEQEFRQRCLDCGAIDYLPKPVSDDSLQRALNDLNPDHHETKVPGDQS